MLGSLRVFYQNVRGVRTKTKNIYRTSLNDNSDVIILTELWLNSSTENSEFIDERYFVYRRDRESCYSLKSDGGGVLIVVFKQRKSYRVTAWETVYKDLWINLVTNSMVISICSLYILSSLKYDTLKTFVKNTEKINNLQS